MSALALKKNELARRAESLPNEVAAWKTATSTIVDLNAHFSQLRAIELLVSTMTGPQIAAASALDPAGDPSAFHRAALKLTMDVAKAQGIWDYFRHKLELRYSPVHKEHLWVADTIAWDCHRSTLNLAVQFGILDANHLREPPLVYCTAEYSAATWVRESRPRDGRDYALGEATLPIPVIEIPWDYLGNSWEYLSLHHEVGHDIEADLLLRAPLQAALQNALTTAGTFAPRIPVWLKWQGEVFADLCALRLAGPAYADVLFQLLLLPQAVVTTFNGGDPHPTPYVRMLMNAAYIRTLGTSQALQDHAAAIETEWRALYGPSSGTPALDAYAGDFGTVFESLMTTKLSVLKDHAVQDLLPFTAAEDQRIRSAATFFRSGLNRPNNLPIRHVPSAARLAISADNSGGTLTPAQCAAVHQRVLQYIRQSAPAGLRGGGPSAHEKYIASFADRNFP